VYVYEPVQKLNCKGRQMEMNSFALKTQFRFTEDPLSNLPKMRFPFRPVSVRRQLFLMQGQRGSQH